MTTIIGISGYKGHGKDSLARMIAECDPSWYLTHFADPLKNMCMKVFSLTHQQVYDDSGKETPLTQPIEMDSYLDLMREATGIDILPRGLVANIPRQVLQYFGTEYVRSVSPTYWIDLLNSIVSSYDKVVISDLRFLNEEKFLKSKDSFTIRVKRIDLPSSGDPHQSELEIASLRPDLELGTLTNSFSLQYKVANLISSLDFSSVVRYDYRSYEYLHDYYSAPSVRSEPSS